MVGMNRKNHRRHSHSRANTVIVGVFVGIVFGFNFVICFIYFSPALSVVPSAEVDKSKAGLHKASSSSSQSSRPGGKNGLQAQVKHQHRRKQRLDCPDYGCPRYPPELTPQLNQSLLNAFGNNPLQKNVHPSSEETTNEDSTVTLSDFSSDWFAMLTQKGKSHIQNQDRGLFISPFLPTDDDDDSDNGTPSFLAAIFDGHGQNGHLVAQEVVESFPRLLAPKLKEIRRNSRQGEDWWSTTNDAAVKAALNETFVEVNMQGSSLNFYLGGCTASVTLRYGSKVYFANAGDSQTVLVSSTSVPAEQPRLTSIEYMTRKDKASLQDEHDRITRLGGKIHVSRKNQVDTRVIVYSEKAHDLIGLAMSRSLGDWEWKLVGVTAEPIVDIIDLSSLMGGGEVDSNGNDGGNGKHFFLIAASDGIWDVRRREFYAAQIAEGFDFQNEGIDGGVQQQRRPLAKLHELIQIATPNAAKGYKDDITAIIAKL